MATAVQQDQRPVNRPATSRPRNGWTRDSVERRVFGVLRWVVIVLLLLVTLFPFYYTVMLSIRPLEAVAQDPGALFVPPNEWVLDSYRAVLASPEAGGQGFLFFIRNSAIIALSTVALTLLVALPGAYAVSRLEFFGRRQISGLFLPSTCSRASCSPCHCSSSSSGSACGGRWSACSSCTCPRSSRCRSTCSATTSTPSR
jgi:hypothetical protein